ncbi:proton-conducting transporter membrane subunit [Aminobacter sp. AP02]|uniref:complex I subunit 5 family protein n=1 Tax=Aminobacter sp. AP02 TaxID=2135737 RepID=UPI000D6B9B2C|nr:proton-conducting transporter membrane subunit [Aminobacter sp. AP02]PWK68997.1 formate hydrogenlyase subunit 3/multisubunit Na+/H+ antiporter MnhD subunit [Aminobacter sp. AP02]
MVEAVLQPLNIFLLGLGGGFLIPLLYKIAKPLPAIAFVAALVGIAAISGINLWALHNGQPTIEILTAGSTPPFSINLRFGLWEGVFTFSVNVAALLGAWHLWGRLRDSYAALLLYLILVMGINGMVMTRDLFNLFVFLEIVSIATYGLLGLDRGAAALAASFKYIMATVLASTFFLLGSVLLYHVTGTLNIDEMIARRDLIAGPIGVTALLLVLSCLVIELKPFPANGWGLDVYEAAPSGVSALISGGVSAGVFFALLKLLPLFENHLGIIAISGGVSFLFSNLIGLKQTNVQRMLGYSSVAQMGLLMLALALLDKLGAEASLPLVVGGLFVNHLFAKAGLFWLAGAVGRSEISAWPAIAGRPLVLLVMALLLVAISGLPPFPGFWAKWELVMQLSRGQQYAWILVILAGSLLEAAYMFSWFKQATRSVPNQTPVRPALRALLPATISVVVLAVSGYLAANIAGVASLWLFAPLCIGGLLYALDWLPGRVKCTMMLLAVLFVGNWIIGDLQGLNRLFAVLLLTCGLVVASAGLYRNDARPGYFPLMAVLLLSIAALLRSSTSLEFFFSWELITLSSYFLIAQGRNAHPHALPFLLFSLVSAFSLLAGFALATAANGTTALVAFGSASGPVAEAAFIFLALGFLIKAGAIGAHVWLPGAYAEADDDLSAMLSSVVSKVAIFGLFIVTYLAIRSETGLELAHVMGWIGLLTTVAGAVMAFQQNDMKRLLAYSSMSQLGYIITAIALMSHLGWVTALYLVANHLMVKGILFLAVAGIILRTGTRMLEANDRLWRKMPLTFATVVIALISMSGLPPLAGFGGKWLLLSAMVEKGWYGLAAIGVLATFIGFLYMFRLAHAVFFGPARPERTTIQEAPLQLLLPQLVLVLAILALSFLPKLFMEPVSQAIDPYFASTLVWEGMSLETIYGYWNPMPVLAASTAAAALLFALAWLIYRRARHHGTSLDLGRFYNFYQAVLAPVVLPVADAFWNGVSRLVIDAAGSVRRLYTGNGQTYLLYVLYYVVAIYVAAI